MSDSKTGGILGTASEKRRSLASRKLNYEFGRKKLNILKPTDGYPTAEEAAMYPHNTLQLKSVHGYNGFNPNSRDNLVVSNDGNFLIYHIAGVCVVHEIETKKQRFFTGHNDDVSCLCLDPREGSTLVASGQTQPIDRPFEKKDLPKVWIWDLKNMSKVELLDKVCWNYVSRINWSPITGFVYVLAGDDLHTMKAFDPFEFKEDYKRVEANEKSAKVKETDQCNFRRLLECETMKEGISGVLVNPRRKPVKKKDDSKEEKEDIKDESDYRYDRDAEVDTERVIDEILIFGKRKFVFMEVRQSAKTVNNTKICLNDTTKSVSISKLNKDGEKAFTAAEFLNCGYYCVGCASGNVYICKSSDAICLIKECHSKPIGALYYTGKRLFSGGFDRMFRTWLVNDQEMKTNGQPFRKKSERYIDLGDSDMVFQPKAIAYAASKRKMFIGVKSNQIVVIDEKASVSESGLALLVDGHDGVVSSLAVHPELDLFITTGFDQSLKLWHAKKLSCVQTHEFLPDSDKKEIVEEKSHAHTRSRSVSKGNVKSGKELVKCCFSNDGKLIAFSTEDSRVCVVPFEQFLIDKERFMKCCMYQIPTKARASKSSVSYMRFSPNDHILAVAHQAEQKVYLFTVIRQKMNKIKLDNWPPLAHHAPPSGVQFSACGTFVKTVTRGFEVVHFQIEEDGKKVKNFADIPDPDEVKWFGEPLVAGWDVQACYQTRLAWEGPDLTEVAVFKDRLGVGNKQKSSQVVAGDAYGGLRIYNYPAVHQKAGILHNGHSEIVESLGILANTPQVITCGGMDMAIMQWEIVQNKEGGSVQSKKAAAAAAGGDDEKKEETKEEVEQKEPAKAKGKDKDKAKAKDAKGDAKGGKKKEGGKADKKEAKKDDKKKKDKDKKK